MARLRKKKAKQVASEDEAALSVPDDGVVEGGSQKAEVLVEERKGLARLDVQTGMPHLNAKQLKELIDGQAKFCGIQIWDKMPFENAKHFSYFSLYKDMGINRDIKYLVNTAATMESLSAWRFRFQWAYRLDAYDAFKAEHASRDIEGLREAIISQKHGNLLRLEELNGMVLNDPNAFENEQSAKLLNNVGAYGLEMMKVSNDTHKTMFGEKKQILSKSKIDINLSTEYGDALGV